MDNDINEDNELILFSFFSLHSRLTMASHKITKLAGAKPTDEFELSVAQALVDLENNVADLKKELRPLSITAAKEVIRQPTPPFYPTRHDNKNTSNIYILKWYWMMALGRDWWWQEGHCHLCPCSSA